MLLTFEDDSIGLLETVRSRAFESFFSTILTLPKQPPKAPNCISSINSEAVEA